MPKAKKPAATEYEMIDAQRLNDSIWDSDGIVAMKISDALTIKVNPSPALEEKIAFVKKVVDDSFVDETDVYFCRTRAIFDVLFLLVFTDYSFPDSVRGEDKRILVEDAYNYLRTYDLDEKFKTCVGQQSNLVENLRAELWRDTKSRLEDEKAKRVALLSRNFELEEALVNLNALIKSGATFLSSAMGKLGEFIPQIEGLITNPDVVGNVLSIFKSEPSKEDD